jgi:hypothetical protein
VKLGAENRTKLVLAGALLVVAVALGARFVGSLGGGSSSAAAPVATTASASLPDPPAPRSAAKSHASGKKPASGRSLDPTLRFDLLKASEDTKYEGTGRDVFRAFVEPPPRLVAPVVKNPQQTLAQNTPPPPPPLPPIDLKFYGFAISKPGEAKRIFLIQGEDVFIAKEGDIVDRRYKVVRISPNAVEILDVLSNNRQSIPLSG